MDAKYSFDYVFFDLNLLINNISITYRHEIGLWAEDGEINGEKWLLKIVNFNGFKFHDFAKKLTQTVSDAIKYIEYNKVDLIKLNSFFIEKLENKRDEFKKIKEYKDKSNQKNINNINMIYLGYQLDYGMHQDAMNSDYDQYSYGEILRQSSKYINIILRELTRLILSLKHQLNLVSIQKENLIANEDNTELLSFITNGKISELLDKLNSLPSYKFDNQVINISAKYRILEKDKINGIINREDYDKGVSMIINGLLNIISNN